MKIESYKIVQSMRSVNKGYQKVVYETESSQMADLHFRNWKKDYPNEHFELFKIIHEEICIDWTGKKKG